jgi:hypothetical protein
MPLFLFECWDQKKVLLALELVQRYLVLVNKILEFILLTIHGGAFYMVFQFIQISPARHPCRPDIWLDLKDLLSKPSSITKCGCLVLCFCAIVATLWIIILAG